MSESTTRYACSCPVSGFVRETVRYHGIYVSRFSAMKFEKLINDDPEGVITVGCFPAVDTPYGITSLDGDEAIAALWADFNQSRFCFGST